MPSKRTTIALALATVLGISGCGGSGNPSSQTTSNTGAGKASLTAASSNAENSRPQFLAFANAVNLKPQDMPGFVGKTKESEHGSQIVNSVKDKARYERCLGIGKQGKPLFKHSSEKFEAGRGLRYLSASSEVEVARTKARAEKELTIARGVLTSPAKRGCVAQAFEALLGGTHTIHTRGHAVRITIGNTRVQPLEVGAAAAGTSGGFGISFSMDVTYSFSVYGRALTLPGVFYVDSLDFVVGRASVGLTTMTFGSPFPPAREATLFSLLVTRARNAGRDFPAISE